MKGANIMNKLDTKKALKAIGYGLSLSEKQSPFSDKIVTFKTLIMPNKDRIMITSASVFGAEFYQEHKTALELINGLTM
jgi:hypothetical protein